MSFLLRPRNLFVVLTYLLLSCIPFAAALFGQPLEHAGAVAGIELMCWTGVWALFKRPAYFHWLLLPAFLALPVELYLYAFYGQGISTHHLGILFETSPAEAMEFLGAKVWLLIGVFAGVLAWFGASWRAAWRTRDLDWNDVSCPIVLGVLALAALVFGYGLEFGVAPPSLALAVLPARAVAAPIHLVKAGANAAASASAGVQAGEETAAPNPGSAPPRRALPRWRTGPGCRSTSTPSPTPGRSA